VTATARRVISTEERMTTTTFPPGGLEHDALFYPDDDAYRTGVLGFVRAGLERDEPVLVAVPEPNLTLVRSALRSGERARVRTTDMGVAGRNPGRIIGSVLTAFVREHRGRRVRIVGEPIWPGRSAEEYPACAEHEALINVALADAPAYILCPYDTARLDRQVLVDATWTHPVLAENGRRRSSPGYHEPTRVAARFDRPLPAPPPDAGVLVLTAATGPRAARRFVHEFAETAGMTAERLTDLRRAVQELAVNTLLHSGTAGLLSIWEADGHVVVQVEDGGRIVDPLVGRRPPSPPEVGHGLFVVHELADLVRLHHRPDGATIQVSMALGR
jgi:anti-sigma regulatory factor (Ser/Thr protein kinase)